MPTWDSSHGLFLRAAKGFFIRYYSVIFGVVGSKPVDFWVNQHIYPIINSCHHQSNNKAQIYSSLWKAWHPAPGISVPHSDYDCTGEAEIRIVQWYYKVSLLQSWLLTGFNKKSCSSVLSQEKIWYQRFWTCTVWWCNLRKFTVAGDISRVWVPPKKGKSLYILSGLNWEEKNVDDIQSLLGKSCLDLFSAEGCLFLFNYLWSNLEIQMNVKIGYFNEWFLWM